MARQRKSKPDFEFVVAKFYLVAWFAFEGSVLGAVISAVMALWLLGWDTPLKHQLAAAGVGFLLGGILGGVWVWWQANRDVWRD